MLVIERKTGEEILIGADIRVVIQRIRAREVGLAISAPTWIPVARIEEGVAVRSKKSYDIDPVSAEESFRWQLNGLLFEAARKNIPPIVVAQMLLTATQTPPPKKS